jgi:hypothetical protein
MTIYLDRLEVANKVLKTIGNETYEFVVEQGRLYLTWTVNEQSYRRLCILQRGSHYFNSDKFSRNLGTGGTGESAIVQLVRWIKGRNTLPIRQWQYWASSSVKLWQDDTIANQVILWLREGNYPIEATCVFCNKTVYRYDWWSLPGKKEGLGCYKPETCPNL